VCKNKKLSFDQLAVGDCVTIERGVTRAAVDHLAAVVGHVDPDDGAWASAGSGAQPSGAIGAWVSALISATLALMLPGTKMGWLVQTLRFHEPIELGDSIAVTVTVIEKVAEGRRVLLDCMAVNQRGRTVVSGSTEATMPPA
jgi:phosphate acetyltransferase/phosphate butyryltransferase